MEKNSAAEVVMQAYEYAFQNTPDFVKDFLKEEHLEDKLIEFFKKKNNPKDLNGQRICIEYCLGDGDIDDEITLEFTNEDLELLEKWWEAYRKKFPEQHDFAYAGSWEVAFTNFDEDDIDDIIRGCYNVCPCKAKSIKYDSDLKDWTEEELSDSYYSHIGDVFNSLFDYAKHWELNECSDDHLYECPDGSCR